MSSNKHILFNYLLIYLSRENTDRCYSLFDYVYIIISTPSKSWCLVIAQPMILAHNDMSVKRNLADKRIPTLVHWMSFTLFSKVKFAPKRDLL